MQVAAAIAIPTCLLTPRHTEWPVARANVAPMAAAPATPAATDNQMTKPAEEKNQGLRGTKAPMANAENDQPAAT